MKRKKKKQRRRREPCDYLSFDNKSQMLTLTTTKSEKFTLATKQLLLTKFKPSIWLLPCLTGPVAKSEGTSQVFLAGLT